MLNGELAGEWADLNDGFAPAWNGTMFGGSGVLAVCVVVLFLCKKKSEEEL